MSNKDLIENKPQQSQIRPIKPIRPVKPVKPIARPAGSIPIKPVGAVQVQKRPVMTKPTVLQKTATVEEPSTLNNEQEVSLIDNSGNQDVMRNVDTNELELIDESGLDAEIDLVDEPIQEVEVEPEVIEEPIQEIEVKAQVKSKDKNKAKNKNKDFILYLVIDKPVFGILNYFREHGVNVSNMFDDVTEAKNMVLMQSEPVRIVVVDTGTGKFATPVVRKELIDMLGISDENNKITVFYIESALKLDTTRALGNQVSKEIDWIPYKSTMVVVATLLSYHENYIDDYPDDPEEFDDVETLLAFKGEQDKSWGELTVMDITGFSADNIRTHVVKSEDNRLEGFKIKI